MKNATIAMNAIPIANDVTEMINSAESRGSRKIKIPETNVKKMATRNQARPSSGDIVSWLGWWLDYWMIELLNHPTN
jgi:hypothetical protein